MPAVVALLASHGFFLPLVVRMTALRVGLSPKTRKPAGCRRAFSLYFYFSSLGGNGMPSRLRFLLFGMLGLGDFFRAVGLTRFAWPGLKPLYFAVVSTGLKPGASTRRIPCLKSETLRHRSGQAIGHPCLRHGYPPNTFIYDSDSITYFLGGADVSSALTLADTGSLFTGFALAP
jgi:hypothetical protein